MNDSNNNFLNPNNSNDNTVNKDFNSILNMQPMNNAMLNTTPPVMDNPINNIGTTPQSGLDIPMQPVIPTMMTPETPTSQAMPTQILNATPPVMDNPINNIGTTPQGGLDIPMQPVTPTMMTPETPMTLNNETISSQTANENLINTIGILPTDTNNMTSVAPSPQSQPTNSENNQNITPQANASSTTENTTGEDEELLKAFIGKNYEKITTRPFNFAGFFFTSLYMFYRKMFLYGFLVFILNLIIINLIDISIISLAINVLIGVFVNKIYLKHAKSKINKIKTSNAQKSFNEIKEICSSKGGTSVGKLFLGLFLEILTGLVVVVVMISIGMLKLVDLIGDLLPGVIQSGNLVEENKTFDGVLSSDTSIKISDEFTIIIPNNFEEGMMNDENSYDYEYSSDSGGFNTCSFSLKAINGYSTAENLITQMATYYTNNNRIETASINNIEWSWFSYPGSFGTSYYYATTKNNKVFLFQYEIEDDAPSDCESYKDQVITSINSK